MNIFFLDRDPTQNAKYYYNRHVIKIILEITQMLYTIANYAKLDVTTNNPFSPYKSTHPKHPMTLWLSQSTHNIDFAFEIGFELCLEYTRRYSKIHKCAFHLAFLRQLFNTCSIIPIDYSKTTVIVPLEKDSLIQVPLCMPTEYRDMYGIQSYRKYYLYSKSHVRTCLENCVEF